MLEYIISNSTLFNYFVLLKWNLLWNSYFQDSMSLYMMHLVAFHNRVVIYLIVILIVIIWYLINLFIPLSLNYLSNRTLFVLIINNYYILPIKVFALFIILKIYGILQKDLYSLYNYYKDEDNFYYDMNIIKVRSNNYKIIKSIDKKVGFDLLDFDLEDLEIYLKQKQAYLMLDYVPINRGFYWKNEKININNFSNVINKFKDLRSFKFLVSIFEASNYKNIKPSLFNSKSNINNVKSIYEATSFKHDEKLEIVFTSIPSIIVLTIISPSIALIVETDTEVSDPELIVKVQGSQWYWTYEIILDL